MSDPAPVPAAARIRLLVKSVTPPFLWQLLKRAKDAARPAGAPPAAAAPPQPQEDGPRPRPPEWEYVPEGWARQASDPRVKGWDVNAIAASYRAKWPAFVRALEPPRPLGIAHEVPVGVEVPNDDRAAHNTLVSYAYVLALAAGGRPQVSLLDWGGGSGHYYLVSKSVLPGVEIDYHCKDVPKLCALGRELVPEGRFYDDESCLERTYDLVLASGSLQYSAPWQETLARLAAAAARYLFVTRLPIALDTDSFVVVQRPYAYGYETEYLGWVLNRGEVIAAGEAAGLELAREFLMSAWLSAEGAPEVPVEYRGYLFRRPERPRHASTR